MAMFSREDIKELKGMFTEMVKEEAKGYIAEEMKAYVPEASKALAKVMMEEVTASFTSDITPKTKKSKSAKPASDFNPDGVEWKDGTVLLRLKQEDVFSAKTSTVNADNAFKAWTVTAEARTKTLRKCANQHIKSMDGIFTLYRLGKNRKDEESLYTCYGFIAKPETKGWTKSGNTYVKLLDISAAEQHDIWIK